MKILFMALLAGLLAGCVSAPTLQTTFDPAEADFINRQGDATVSGQAFLRRNDGIVIYAAGSDVILIPSTAYSRERIAVLYRGGKFNNAVPAPENTDPRYEAMTRVTRANGEGRFSFPNVADGDYFVVTSVIWRVGDWPQGGGLMENVSIRNGESVDIIMTGR